MEGVRVARSKMRSVKDEEVLLSTCIKNIRAEICEFEMKDKFADGLMVPVLLLVGLWHPWLLCDLTDECLGSARTYKVYFPQLKSN
jgi:hypothetical protein